MAYVDISPQRLLHLWELMWRLGSIKKLKYSDIGYRCPDGMKLVLGFYQECSKIVKLVMGFDHVSQWWDQVEF